jgi:hypothetical protein
VFEGNVVTNITNYYMSQINQNESVTLAAPGFYSLVCRVVALVLPIGDVTY